MSLKIPKKIAVFQDIAGFGRCSMTVALPVISALKVQACPIPTSILSNHTGFPTYSFHDYTEHIPVFLEKWEELSLTFDGIYSGFLGSIAQVQLVKNFILKQPNAIVIVDPVMGDDGKPYKTINSDFTNALRELVGYSHIITPNITEACLLTNTPYKKAHWNSFELKEIASKLHDLGPKHIIITGILQGDCLLNYQSTKGQEPICHVNKIKGESRPGTGDLFASIIAACAVNGLSLTQNIQKASSFVSKCTQATSELNIPLNEGVCFELFLNEL